MGGLRVRIDHYLLSHLSLLQRFMILCAVVLLAASVVLGERIAQNVQRDMMRATAFNTALYVGGVVGSQLEKADETLQLTADDQRILELLFSPQRLGSEIVSIKTWSTDGTVIFATNKELIGRRFPIGEDLAESLGGEVHYETTSLDKEENVGEREMFTRLLEVYAPIYSRTTRKVIGVSEVYQRVDRIPEFISTSRREVWLLVVAAFVLLYATLSGIVKRASDTIAQQHEQLRVANRLLEERATTDSLTGLYNHRFFEERLQEEMARASRCNQPLALLFGDLDHFKSLNDRFGHQAGDLILRATAEVILKVVRSTDIATRYGGEEYAIILPKTDKAAAAVIAERLRGRVEAERVVLPDGCEARVTMSIGVASVPVDAVTKELLVAKADEAMYEAKQRGRNRVVHDHALV